jgi:hypothetical protein
MNWYAIARSAVRLAHRRSRSGISLVRSRWILPILGVVILGFSTGVLVLVGFAGVLSAGPASAAAHVFGIPPIVFSAYLDAESNADTVADGCQVPWPVVAGIWKVESNHATQPGHTINPAGTITPPLYGPILDGSTAGAAIIGDTDQGVLDANPTWDRAVGPGQFLPGSWRAYGQDGNDDGVVDPQNVYDAALATVAHLCIASPGDYTNPRDLERALRRYNNSPEYVATVRGWIDYYQAFQFTDGLVTADGYYAFPLPTGSVTVAQLRRSHHDYPASDLAVPEGTPVYAAHAGTVTRISTPCADTQRCRCGWGVHIAGFDGHAYTYCHGTQIATHIRPGVAVKAGALIMTSGNTGNSAAPHLHFQIRNPDGTLICPQTLLEVWQEGIGLSPITAPDSGCTY